MATTLSSKDLAKALNGFLQAPTLPLPVEIHGIIASYLDKHEKPDEASGERLGDELLAIWEKVVQNHPEKYAAFLAILRQLRPGLRTPARVFKWWDRLLDPVLDHAGREKGLAREVTEHTLDLLSADEYDDPTAWSEEGLVPLVNRLLARWMAVRETQPDLRPSTDLKEQMIKDALMAFGKRDPRGFMSALNGFVVKREHRNSALSLLCAFVSSGPPHLHLILQTPLFGNILHSLQKDESTATVNLSLIALVMILPFIPSSLVPFLPTLFNIYARLLFWDRDSYFAQQHTEMGAENGEGGGGIPWDKSLLDPDYDGHSLSYLPEYFTVLYGLYPINFLEYIRKPQRYLRHANNAEDIDVQAMEIRDRSDRFRKQHLLHPNFYNLTIESEKTDLSRWIKSEADEVLADCMALVIDQTPAFAHVRPATPLPGAPSSIMGDALEQEGLDSALLGNPPHTDPSHPALSASSMSIGRANSPSGRRGSQSSQLSAYDFSEAKSRGPGDDSPTLPPDLGPSTSQGQAQGSISSNNRIRSGLHQSLPNDSVPSLFLSPQDQAGEKSPLQQPLGHGPGRQGGSSMGMDDQMALLQHHRLRLINDLQYERFIKDQHMIHMGELRRRQIRVSATEAETQNLVMANRSLRQRFDEAKRGEAQIKKEFDHRRSMTKKWESDLTNKLRALREEQKKWLVEGSDLSQQLERAQAECENLRRTVAEAEGKRLESEQNLEAVDISTAMVERLKSEIARLSASEREFQGKEAKMDTAIQEGAAAEARVERMGLEIAAREEQLHKAEQHYETQIEDLKARLAKALEEKPRKSSSDAAAAYESVLSSVRAKNAALQKQYEAVMKKCTSLEASLLDMRCRAEQKGGRSERGSLADHDSDEPLGMARNPLGIRSRPRGVSDPDVAEGLTQSTLSPPPEPVASPLGPGSPGPLSPTGQGGPSSPHTERYFGRGGKERKDKKEEKSDKKDKKPINMRAIRGFV
ncbi:Hamartin protein-domain-containing protein [Chaetomidium leptoderma]|uniref:Hamartin protein-domain-containing protein n=1 Tax=Chaetomidium leptoderma TaxID=669021 RepID=A0AAN6VHH0_9PEZI|nr:Hamartin protein-domain-containing protein [Chaetomidium leptoderma]